MIFRLPQKEMILAFAFILILFLTLALDFLQPLLPIPAFALSGISASVLLLIIYLKKTWSNNLSIPFRSTMIYSFTMILISIGAVIHQQETQALETNGLLAGNSPYFAKLQLSLGIQTNNTTTASKPQKILAAIPDQDYKQGQIKTTPLATRKLDYKIIDIEKARQPKPEALTARVDNITSDHTDLPAIQKPAPTNTQPLPKITPEDESNTSQQQLANAAHEQQLARQQLAAQGITWTSKEFYKAASEGNIKIMGLFLDSGMPIETPLEDYKQSLIVALIQRNPEATTKSLKFLKNRGLDLNKSYAVFYAAPNRTTRKVYRTLFELAAMNLNTQAVKFFKENGAHSDEVLKLIAHDFNSSTIRSQKKRISEIYKILSGNNSLPDNTNELNAKLADATSSANVALMEFYLLSGAKPEFKIHDKPAYLIFKAAKTIKASEIVDLLIQYGANVNKKSPSGRTPLFLHTQMNRYNAVKSLLAARANPNIQAKDGSTAVYTAARENRIDILHLLLKAGAKVNLSMHNGNSPLMIASLHGHHEIVEILLKHGANTNIRDQKGLSPIDYANVHGHLKVITLLSKEKSLDKIHKPNSG